MSKIEVNQISSQCGSTLTIGQSGDSIQLACGATQTGFGRTGTVDWDTTAKTASFTAVSGNGYFVNTTSGAVTVTLPATPSAGDIVAVKDYAGTAGINSITIARNGSNIRGETNDFTLQKINSGGVFIYVDATEGWQIFLDGSNVDATQTYISATGGTVTTCGDFKIHTFTGPGTFCVSSVGCASVNDTVDYLVVAGGAGGSMGDNAGNAASGAGGLRFSASTYTAPCTSAPRAGDVVTVAATSYPITIGGGGAGIANCTSPTEKRGNSGSNSSFATITSNGGGGGGTYQQAGASGGSGGGTGSDITPGAGGAGNTPPVSPSQGFPGGSGVDPAGPDYPGAGGGGAGAAGENGGPGGCSPGGDGGVGLEINIDNNNYYYSGGGGGSTWTAPFGAGNGGLGGGGGGSAKTGTVGSGGGSALNSGSPGGVSGTSNGGAGGANTGGGGGAAINCISGSSGGGGSGIVIIRYKYQ